MASNKKRIIKYLLVIIIFMGIRVTYSQIVNPGTLRLKINCYNKVISDSIEAKFILELINTSTTQSVKIPLEYWISKANDKIGNVGFEIEYLSGVQKIIVRSGLVTPQTSKAKQTLKANRNFFIDASDITKHYFPEKGLYRIRFKFQESDYFISIVELQSDWVNIEVK